MAVERLTDASFRAELGGTPNAVVCFCARWCGLCMLFARRFERLSGEYTHVRFFRCDTETEPVCRSTVSFESLPFFALYEHGRYVDGFSTTNEDGLRERLETIFGRVSVE